MGMTTVMPPSKISAQDASEIQFNAVSVKFSVFCKGDEDTYRIWWGNL
jgi:hypothetical protein